MANPNSYSDPRQHFGSHFMHTTQQRPPLHQIPHLPVNQQCNEIQLPRGPPGPLQTPPRPGQTMFPPPPFPSPSYPPPQQGAQTLYPPLPPNFSYTAPPPFPYPPANNVIPPEAPSMRIPPPSLDTRLRQPHYNQLSSGNVQGSVSSANNVIPPQAPPMRIPPPGMDTRLRQPHYNQLSSENVQGNVSSANNVIPPQAPPMRIPPPGMDTRLRQPHYNHLSSENVQGNVSSRNSSELFLKTSVLKANEELNECDKSKQNGKKKIVTWLQKTGKGRPGQKPHQKKDTPKLQINDYLCSLQEMTALISKMSSQIEKLESIMSSADKTSWAKDCSEFDNTKEHFVAMENLIESQVVSQAGIKLKRIRQKRARIKRGKQALKEEHLKVQEVRHTRERRIDEWQKKIAQEMRDEKLKKERKINMDRTLAEVTKKIQDASRLIETMSAVEKLRLIRRDAAEKRGDSNLGESRQNVAQKIEDMKRLVQGQLEVYREEERVLRDTIRLEYEESNKKEKQMQQERDEAERKRKERNLYTSLFGNSGDVDMSDPLYPYQEFYKQAQKSLPALLQIRQEWDRYITSSDAGSTIPSSWICPCPPSSEAWAATVVQE